MGGLRDISKRRARVSGLALPPGRASSCSIGRGEVEILGPDAGYGDIAIHPDGRRVLFDRAQGKTGIRNLWILDLEQRVETRVTSDPTDEFRGIWFPDGKSIVYTAEIGGLEQLRRRELATGRVQALLPEGEFQEAGAVVPGGEQLVYRQKTERGNDEARLVSLSGDQKSSTLFQTGFDVAAMTSPDGRFIVLLPAIRFRTSSTSLRVANRRKGFESLPEGSSSVDGAAMGARSSTFRSNGR